MLSFSGEGGKSVMTPDFCVIERGCKHRQRPHGAMGNETMSAGRCGGCSSASGGRHRKELGSIQVLMLRCLPESCPWMLGPCVSLMLSCTHADVLVHGHCSHIILRGPGHCVIPYLQYLPSIVIYVVELSC